MMFIRKQNWYLLSALLLALLGHNPASLAQESENPQEGFINFAYSSWIGTGYYSIEERSLWILRVPLRSYTLREPEGKQWGVKLLFPLSFGLDQFDEVDRDIASFTFVPGVKLSYSVLDNWQLKPYGQIGVGKDFEGGQWDTIWGYGMLSLVSFPLDYGEIELGNSIRIADHSRAAEGDDGFSMFEVGLNYRRPVGFNFFNRSNSISIFGIYKDFINDLEFINALKPKTIIHELWTVGFVLEVDKPIKFLGLPFTSGGITYTFGDGFTGIGLTTGFPL